MSNSASLHGRSLVQRRPNILTIVLFDCYHSLSHSRTLTYRREEEYVAKENPPVYIRIEVPDSNRPNFRRDGRWLFLEVDPSKLSSSIVKELYEYTFDRGGKNPHHVYRRILTSEATARDTLDVTSLVTLIEDLVGQCRHALDPFGPAGARVAEAVLPSVQIESILVALAAHHVSDAEEQLQQKLYVLLSGLVSLAKELHTLDARAENEAVRADHIERSFADADETNLERFFHWAEAATDVVTLTGQLDELMRSMEEGVTTLKGSVSTASWEFRPTAKELAALTDILIDRDDSFLIAAHAALQERSVPPTLVAMLPEVRARIADAREHIASTLGRLGTAQQVAARTVLSSDHLTNAQGLLIAFQRSVVQLTDHRARSRGGALPYEFSETTSIITKDVYEHAVASLNDPARAPGAYEARLNAARRELGHLMTQRVTLPTTIERDLATAEQYLADLDVLLSGDVAAPVLLATLPERPMPPVRANVAARPLPKKPATIRFIPGQSTPVNGRGHTDAATAPTPSPSGCGVALMEPPPASAEDAPLAPQRVDELYNLVCGVGLILTCNTTFLGASTARSMLEILEQCGACSAAEARAAHQVVSERMVRDAELWDRSSSSPLTTRWRASRHRWIRYQPGRPLSPTPKNGPGSKRWMFKLTETAKPAAVTALERAGITEDDVRAGHVARKQEREERRTNR